MSKLPNTLGNLIERPYRVRYQAVGTHQFAGWGWVFKEDEILTAAYSKEHVYTVKMDEPPEGSGIYILLGEGEIVERLEPVDWARK